MFGIQFLQQLSSPFFDWFFEAITVLAEPFVGLVVVAVIYWCADKKFSVPFCLTVVSTFGLNTALKNILRIGRPYNKYEYMYAPEGAKETGKLFVLRSETATGYSFPSGHTQFAASMYGLIAFKIKRWLGGLLAVVILLIAASRMYLGVHTFYDVTVALVLSGLWCIVSMKFYRFIQNKSPYWLFLYAVPAAVALCAMDTGAVGDTFTVLGLSLGSTTGLFLEKKYIGFNPCGGVKQNIFKISVGILGSLVLYVGPKLVMPAIVQGLVADEIRHFVSTFLVAVWIFAVIPKLAQLIFERKKHE